MTIKRRLKELEARLGPPLGPVHRVVVSIGQTQDEALHAYGRDRIAPRDRIILRTIVQPGE